MSYRNIYYNSRAKKMTLFTWDKDGNPIREEYDYKPWLYVGTTGSKDAVSMFNTPLKKITFNIIDIIREYIIKTSTRMNFIFFISNYFNQSSH